MGGHMIIVGNYYAWLILPIVICLIGILLRRIVVVHSLVNRISAPHHRLQLIHHFSFPKLIIRACLLSCSLLLILGALFRVRYESADKQPLHEHGRDVVIALDISRSMLAQDYQPNRLKAAKNKIKALLSKLTWERVGLIIFAGSALVQCPLTKDFEVFELFLDALDVESLSHGTTDIGSALQMAISVFERTPDKKNRLLVMLTDGEDFSTNLAEIQKRATDCGIRICAVGMGTPNGAPIPLFTQDGKLEGHVRDEQGNVVMSRLNESMLRTLTQSLSGLYLNADQTSNDDIDRLCEWVKTFEQEQFSVTNHIIYEESFMYFSGIGLISLLLSMIL